MRAEHIGELVWHRQAGATVLNVLLPGSVKSVGNGRGRTVPLHVQGLALRPVTTTVGLDVIYKQPIALEWSNGHWKSGPVFAILAGPEEGAFAGSKANFRDIMKIASEEGTLMYVLSPGNVTRQPVWRGFVRLGYQRWVCLPCPRPQAVYNRVPTRNLERSNAVTAAKRTLLSMGIPVFNPEYFNKKVIYTALENSSANRYLPETIRLDGAQSLEGMVKRHGFVYLKPTGGSIGHGIMRVDARGSNRFQVSVLKNNTCTTYQAHNDSSLWTLIRKHRLPGEYVIQAGKSLIQFRGRPCDFRILTQKNQGLWRITGVGVRVAGPDTITTHVPNGGSIANAKAVLASAYGDRASDIEEDLHRMVQSCATIIDSHYHGRLGEMSMDVGLDEAGKFWFFEANAKPMKFDEPDIREKSIRGVLDHLEYLAMN